MISRIWFSVGLCFTGNCNQEIAKNKSKNIRDRPIPSTITIYISSEITAAIKDRKMRILPAICWALGTNLNSRTTKRKTNAVLISAK